MSNFAIMRIEKRKDIGSVRRCAEHHLRAVDTPNADPSRPIRVLAGSPDANQTTGIIVDSVKPLMKRKDAIRCLDVFCGASPEFFASGGSIRDFEARAMKWAADTFGADNIALAVTHEDETTPHVQLLITPIIKGKLSASHWLDGPKKLRALQDGFAAAMSPLGLDRGVKGSKAKHEDIKTWYGGLEERAKKAQKVIDQAAQVKADQVARQLVIDARADIVKSNAALLLQREKQLEQRALELDRKQGLLEKLAAELQWQKEALLKIFDKLPFEIRATLGRVFGKKDEKPAPAPAIEQSTSTPAFEGKPALADKPYRRPKPT